MSLKTGVEVNILEAQWISDYTLDITFSDGSVRKVDFQAFLSGSCLPDVRKYLDVDRFKGFEISYGNLVWNDYDLCFSIEDLYTGNLMAGREAGSMVAEEFPEYGKPR